MNGTRKTWRELFGRWQTWAIIAFVIVFSLGLARETLADEAPLEARLGLGFGVTNDNTWTTQHLEVGNRNWYGSAMRTGSDPDLPDTWRIAAGWRVDWREDTKVSPFMRMGAAYWLDEPTVLISDRLSYDMSVGARLWRVIDLEWQHNSTAGRSDFNKGNDLVVLSFVFPF